MLSSELCRCLKKNQSTPRPSEHPPVMGGEMSKRLGGIKGCKYKASVPLIVSCPADHVQYRIGNHVYYYVWLRPDRLMQ